MRWLDNWTKNTIVRELNIDESAGISEKDIEKYQLIKLNQILRLVQEKSAFYQERLLGMDLNETAIPVKVESKDMIQLNNLKDIEKLPFTTADDLKNEGFEMCCIRPDSISRIVTLTAGKSQRDQRKVVFSVQDQERATDFFCCSMGSMVDENDRVLILRPCRKPGSQGDLMRHALERIGVETVPYGPLNDDVADWGVYLDLLRLEKITSIVGTTSEIVNLAQVAAGRAKDRRYAEAVAEIKSRMKSVILSGEYVTDDKVEAIKDAWNCKIYEHYGVIEMGIGGLFGCDRASGYHLKEGDLYIEIIDPETGDTVPDGEFGEVVFTTLTRSGMPLIRYRTGDRSRIITEPCLCGSSLRRLDRVADGTKYKRTFMRNSNKY